MVTRRDERLTSELLIRSKFFGEVRNATGKQLETPTSSLTGVLGPFVKLVRDLWCDGVVPFWEQFGELHG